MEPSLVSDLSECDPSRMVAEELCSFYDRNESRYLSLKPACYHHHFTCKIFSFLQTPRTFQTFLNFKFLCPRSSTEKYFENNSYSQEVRFSEELIRQICDVLCILCFSKGTPLSSLIAHLIIIYITRKSQMQPAEHQAYQAHQPSVACCLFPCRQLSHSRHRPCKEIRCQHQSRNGAPYSSVNKTALTFATPHFSCDRT